MERACLELVSPSRASMTPDLAWHGHNTLRHDLIVCMIGGWRWGGGGGGRKWEGG